MSVDISATYLVRNTLLMLLVNNSLGGGHGECTKQMRKPRQTKKSVLQTTAPKQRQKQKQKNSKSWSATMEIFSLWGEPGGGK